MSGEQLGRMLTNEQWEKLDSKITQNVAYREVQDEIIKTLKKLKRELPPESIQTFQKLDNTMAKQLLVVEAIAYSHGFF